MTWTIRDLPIWITLRGGWVPIEGGTPATVAIVEAAEVWPDKCGEIGFDDRQTALLEKMLRTRIGNLR
jgi:hypothetical protein